MPSLDPAAYEPARAEWIAQQYATGEPFTGLADLHRAFPEVVPPTLVLRRWRTVWPAFDALMIEAEKARAIALVEATMPIADNVTLNAAQAKNAIGVRFRMAESLAPEIFGKAASAKAPGDDDARTLLAGMTDAQLIRIMAGEDVRAVLGNAPTTPPLPPTAARPGLSGGSEVIPPTSTRHLEGTCEVVPRETGPGVDWEEALATKNPAETSD